MSNEIRGSAAPTRPDDFQPALASSMAVLESLMEAQRVQLEVLNSCQQSIAAINQELWDEWVCHWGGGAPIDV
jgi:hypothetical protein